MEITRDKNRAATIKFPMYDSANPESLKSGLTAFTVTAYYDDGGGDTLLSIADTPSEVAVSLGMYTLDLTASERNHDLTSITITAANAVDQTIVIKSEEPRPTGTVVFDGGNGAASFKTDLPATVDDTYKGSFVRFITGSLGDINSRQVMKINAYNGATKFVTVQGGFTAAPGTGDVFELINN